MKNQKLFSLWAALIVSIATISAAESPAEKHPAAVKPSDSSKAFKNIGVDEFDKLRKQKTNVVLDVRTPKEYQESHIPGSTQLDFKSPDFEKELKKLDPNKTYLVHCASGGRSSQTAAKMKALNFKNVYNLEGGMKAWEKAGKPVVTGEGDKPAKEKK